MNYLARRGRNPWSVFEELDELHNALTGGPATHERMGTILSPRMNAWEEGDKLFVEVELPGVSRDDIDISIVDNELTVSGKTEEKEVKKEATYHRRERRSCEFSRTVTLPYKPESDNVTAVSENGVLTISIPRPKETKPRKITVKAA